MATHKVDNSNRRETEDASPLDIFHGRKRKVGRPKKATNKLTLKQEKFVKAYTLTCNETEAKLQAGYAPTTNVLSIPVIAMSIEEHREKMENLFRGASEAMFMNLYALAMSAKSEMVRFQATKDMLDRAGFKPADKREISGADGHAISVENRITHDLINRFIALEATDERTEDKLEEAMILECEPEALD